MSGLRFYGEKGILAWLRSPLGYKAKMSLIADETWAHGRVLIVHEGNAVSVYTNGNIIVKVVERPTARTPAGNDRCDEILENRVGWVWSDVHVSSKFRMCFETDSRTLQEMAGLKNELGR